MGERPRASGRRGRRVAAGPRKRRKSVAMSRSASERAAHLDRPVVRRLLATGSMWLVLVAPSLAARAQSGTTAAQHREKGYAAFQLGHYDQAIEEFQAAYHLEQDARLFYNLGL